MTELEEYERHLDRWLFAVMVLELALLAMLVGVFIYLMGRS